MYNFITTCVGANADDIHELVDLAGIGDLHSDMECGDFEELAPGVLEEFSQLIDQDIDFIRGDFYVSYNQSYYQGLPCVYIKHSGIEYVFVESEYAEKVLHGEDSEKRVEAKEEIDELLEKPYEILKSIQGEFSRGGRDRFFEMFLANPYVTSSLLESIENIIQEADSHLENYVFHPYVLFSDFRQNAELVEFLWEQVLSDNEIVLMQNAESKIKDELREKFNEFDATRSFSSSSEIYVASEFIRENIEALKYAFNEGLLSEIQMSSSFNKILEIKIDEPSAVNENEVSSEY